MLVKIKLVVFDMDGVIFKDKNFWMLLHKAYGTYEEGKELTDKYLHSDYEMLAKEVVGRLWKGKSFQPYMDLVNSRQYTKGAKELFAFLKEHYIKTCILTTGPKDLALRAKKDLGADFAFYNEIVFKDGFATGEYFHITGSSGKGDWLVSFCEENGFDLKEVAVVGDSRVDISKATVAGLSVSFNSNCKELDKACDYVIKGDDLRQLIMYLQL
ncbi:HAD family phosphatase [Candidatus Woesearchaeota archaeon]|nr:HAD family phosphatase [Candidatus Woesearchaeota archaeon]